MKKPLVSIITVVFNGERTLEATIRSVESQTLADREYIVVDGGSKDATVSILKRHTDTVTRWISEPDKGIYDAMNKGIRMAEGEWLYFLGSDDCFENAAVLADIFSGSVPDVDLLYGDVISPSYRGRYDGEFTRDKLLGRNISHQAAFYRKRIFDRLGEYDLRFRTHADWDFNLRCFGDPAFRAHYTGVLVASFGADGASAGHDLTFLRERLIPLKLDRLEQTGTGVLRRIRFYDEWWRFLRNAGLRDRALLAQSMPGRVLPRALRRMLGWQRAVPESLLKNSFFSKGWMFGSYLTNLITGSL